jgi:hypothetical protein
MLLSLGGHSYEIVKTHLHHLQIAAAINLTRIESWLRAQQQGTPARRTRPLSRFARLQKREAS